MATMQLVYWFSVLYGTMLAGGGIAGGLKVRRHQTAGRPGALSTLLGNLASMRHDTDAQCQSCSLTPMACYLQGSTGSVIAGVGAGAAVLALEVMLQRAEKRKHILAAVLVVVAAAVGAMMSRRYSATRRFMPAGLVAAMSALACVAFILRAFTLARQNKAARASRAAAGGAGGRTPSTEGSSDGAGTSAEPQTSRKERTAGGQSQEQKPKGPKKHRD